MKFLWYVLGAIPKEIISRRNENVSKSFTLSRLCVYNKTNNLVVHSSYMPNWTPTNKGWENSNWNGLSKEILV